MGSSFPMHVREIMEEDREKGTAYLAADGVGKIVGLDIGGAVKLEFKEGQKWYPLGEVLRVPEWGTESSERRSG